MKICLIDWFAYGLFNSRSKIVFGGAQIQLYLLAKELSKDNQFDISFLTDNQSKAQVNNFGKIKLFQWLRSIKTLGIKGRLLKGSGYFFIRLFHQLNKINSDVYMQRAASAETGLIALVCKLLRKRFIFMVAHEQDVNGNFIRQNGWRGKLFLLGLNLADKIICQTQDQQELLRGSLKTKSVVVRSGYPIKPPKKLKKADILWVARAEKWKGPEMYIRLAKKFPREKFVMICPPAENNPKYFEFIKTKACTDSNLKFIKQTPFSKINAYFAKAKLFVSTSLSEGFPNTFLQSGNNLTPIISFKVNPDKIIDRYRIGFCAGGDEKQMEKLLRQILKNNRLRQEMGLNAFNYVKQCHDIRQTTANIIANIF